MALLTFSRRHILLSTEFRKDREMSEICWDRYPHLAQSSYGRTWLTIQQRLTAVRLFYDYLTEEGLRETNPVGRGRYTPGKQFGGVRSKGLIPRYTKLPWIPNETEWSAVLAAAKSEPLRNRLMLALEY